MASVQSGDMKFGQLKDDEKLMVAGHLPFDDKIKWVDIFSPVVSKIDTFDARKVANSFEEVVESIELFAKLKNVTKILLPIRKTDIDKWLLDAITKSENSKIRSFIVEDDRDHMFSIYDETVAKYIRNVRKNDPNYDASDIDYVFNFDNGIELFNDYDDLKLKLFMKDGWEDLLYHHDNIDDKHIRDMVTMLLLKEDRYVDTREPREIIFDSVHHLIYRFYEDPPFLEALGIRLERLLNLTPNVSKLTLHLISDRSSGFEVFKECLLSIPNLEQLELLGYVSMESRQLQDLISVLLAPRDGNLLTRLRVSLEYVGMDISCILAMDMKDDIKSLHIEATTTNRGFIVNRSYMLIKNINLPLIDTLNKFPRVKYIDVITKDRKYKRQLETDIEVVRAGLARNKSVTLTVRLTE